MGGLYILIVILDRYQFQSFIDVQTTAIILTGLAVIWYANETQLIREETQKQTKLQFRPFIIYDIKSEERISKSTGQIDFIIYYNELKNIGNMPALSIEVKEYELEREFTGAGFEKEDIEIYLSNHVLRKGKVSSMITRSRGHNINDPMFCFRSVTIEYRDINDEKYTTKTTCKDWHWSFEDIKV